MFRFQDSIVALACFLLYVNFIPFSFANKMSSEDKASFEDVKSVENNPNTLLIDVRQPSELEETGIIPGSINIPLGDLEKTLKNATNDEFKRKYGREKPNENSPLIFSCRSGRRSAIAQETAIKLGYKNVRNYFGGWLDWEERIKEVV